MIHNIEHTYGDEENKESQGVNPDDFEKKTTEEWHRYIENLRNKQSQEDPEKSNVDENLEEALNNIDDKFEKLVKKGEKIGSKELGKKEIDRKLDRIETDIDQKISEVEELLKDSDIDPQVIKRLITIRASDLSAKKTAEIIKNIKASSDNVLKGIPKFLRYLVD